MDTGRGGCGRGRVLWARKRERPRGYPSRWRIEKPRSLGEVSGRCGFGKSLDRWWRGWYRQLNEYAALHQLPVEWQTAHAWRQQNGESSRGEGDDRSPEVVSCQFCDVRAGRRAYFTGALREASRTADGDEDWTMRRAASTRCEAGERRIVCDNAGDVLCVYCHKM